MLYWSRVFLLLKKGMFKVSAGRKFIVGYVLWLALLYLLFFIEGFSPFYIVNHWQTHLTIIQTQWWVDTFSIPVKMVGDTIHLDNGFDIWILNNCNGMEPYVLYVAGILAYPNTWYQKGLWIVYGYLFVLLLNTVRIDVVVYVTMLDKTYFELIHDFIGRVIMLFLTLGLFVYYSWLTEKRRQAVQ